VAVLTSVLSSAGRKWNFRPFKILPVSSRSTEVATRSQISLSRPRLLTDVTAPEILLIPGGYGARRSLSDEGLVAWLRSEGPAAGNVVACNQGVLLAAKAGLALETEVTSSADVAAELAEIEPSCRIHTEGDFRVSGKMITARHAVGAARAALHLVRTLLGEKHAVEIENDLGLPPPEPVQGKSTLEIIKAR